MYYILTMSITSSNYKKGIEKAVLCCKPVLKTAWKISGIYIIWIFIHFFASHLYVKYCTPYTIIGFITAPILIASPHCIGLRWCITHGASTITAMWIVIGTWFATRLG